MAKRRRERVYDLEHSLVNVCTECGAQVDKKARTCECGANYGADAERAISGGWEALWPESRER